MKIQEKERLPLILSQELLSIIALRNEREEEREVVASLVSVSGIIAWFKRKELLGGRLQQEYQRWGQEGDDEQI